jgi:copper(I)-binding protein
MQEAKSKCSDLGFKPGTEKYGSCVLKLSSESSGTSAASSSQSLQASSPSNNTNGVGRVIIADPYSRNTVPGQQVAGGFMTIRCPGCSDILVSASSPVSNEVQLHTMLMEGNVMKMTRLNNIEIPQNSSVELRPGGLHLMFMGIRSPFKAGDEIPVFLKFEKSGTVETKIIVKSL